MWRWHISSAFIINLSRNPSSKLALWTHSDFVFVRVVYFRQWAHSAAASKCCPQDPTVSPATCLNKQTHVPPVGPPTHPRFQTDFHTRGSREILNFSWQKAKHVHVSGAGSDEGRGSLLDLVRSGDIWVHIIIVVIFLHQNSTSAIIL